MKEDKFEEKESSDKSIRSQRTSSADVIQPDQSESNYSKQTFNKKIEK
jgi:hypothetical protein